jgi:uncharacterized protein YjiS (DUF1127 family)
MSHPLAHGFGPPFAGRQASHPLSPTAAAAWHTLWTWIGRHRQRKALAELARLNGHLLRDIGISQEDALREAAKPFWQ